MKMKCFFFFEFAVIHHFFIRKLRQFILNLDKNHILVSNFIFFVFDFHFFKVFDKYFVTFLIKFQFDMGFFNDIFDNISYQNLFVLVV